MTIADIDFGKLAVIIPTLNAGEFATRQVAAFEDHGIPPSCFLVIDSGSKDRTVETYSAFGAEVVGIDGSTFNHGGTRRYATTLRPDADFIVMLTQDAIPASGDTLLSILRAFEEPKVGMAYGRQLPRHEAKGIERHARLTNYPQQNEVRSFADRERLGVKTVFCSDSFAAYRRTALMEVGNFPEDAYFAEDQIIAGRMLKKGWKLSYRGDAPVIHSHGYSIREDFHRYFDVGVFHARNRWLVDEFGKAEGEGVRFLKSEIAYLLRNEPSALPSAALRTVAKYVGYRLGQKEADMSFGMKKKLSMQAFYWRQKEAQLSTEGNAA